MQEFKNKQERERTEKKKILDNKNKYLDKGIYLKMMGVKKIIWYKKQEI